MSVESHGITDVGCVRDENEDRILIEPGMGVFAVCDGMGGHQNGGLAAELAIDTLRYFVEASQDRYDVSWPFGYNFELSVDANRLVTGVRLANDEIRRRAGQDTDSAGMGTTIAAVIVSDTRAVIANVGDSRVYRFRDGALKQLSVDDTMVGSMVQRGLISAGEVRNHPMRNVLTQAAGAQESLEVHIAEEPLREGDLLLICSDGLYGTVDEDAIRSIVGCGDSLDFCSLALVRAARAAGAPDNVSVLLLRYN